MTNNQMPIELFKIVYYKAPKDRIVSPSYTPANHERIEIITSGRVWFGSEKNGRYYGRGAIFRHVEGEHTVHKSEPGNPYRCLVLQYSGIAKRQYPRINFWSTSGTLSIFREEVLSAFHNPDFDRTILGDYTISTINWHCAQTQQSHEAEEIPSSLRQTISYLHKHPESNISVEQLAEMANYSKAHFHGLFKKYFNMTPHQYHLNYRINLSREKLAASSIPIEEISRLTGFESLENFYRAFQRLCKTTPAQYRKDHSLVSC